MAHPTRAEELVDAAETVFKQSGFSEARMEDIAAAVGLQKASLYRHTSSKSELIFLIVKRDLEHRTTDLISILASQDPASVRIERAVRHHLEFDLGDLELRQLISTAVAFLRPDDIEKLRALQDRYEQLFRRLIQDAVELGMARGDLDVPTMTRYLLGMLNFPHRWYHHGRRLPKESVIEVGVELALGALGIGSGKGAGKSAEPLDGTTRSVSAGTPAEADGQ